MFNEILTGQASNEPPPERQPPYREPGVLPPVRHACVRCQQAYAAPAGSIAATCPSCQLAAAEEDVRAFRLAEAEHERSEGKHKLFVAIGTILVALLIVAIKVGMRTQLREDAAQAAGYSSYDDYKSERDRVYPNDEYSQRIDGFADQMCRCRDLACAREAQIAFINFTRTSRGPSDDMSEASARASSARLGDCQVKLEAASP